MRIKATNSRFEDLWPNRYRLLAIATVISFVAYLVLFSVGLVPEELERTAIAQPQATEDTTQAANTTNVDELSSLQPTKEQPTRVVINSIGIDTQVLNPVSTDVRTLNSYLARGAVRYPESGHPGNGNLFIFGHSTGRDTVWNQAYKTFNNLEDLERGEEISVHTKSGIYTYEVSTVEFKRDAEAYIPFDAETDQLILSTCDSFGRKEDRIVVRANFLSYNPDR